MMHGHSGHSKCNCIDWIALLMFSIGNYRNNDILSVILVIFNFAKFWWHEFHRNCHFSLIVYGVLIHLPSFCICNHKKLPQKVRSVMIPGEIQPKWPVSITDTKEHWLKLYFWHLVYENTFDITKGFSWNFERTS